MHSEHCLALTLSLSPGRGDRLLPHWKKSPNGEASAAMENGLPLLGGEGRGEGERFFRLNASGSGIIPKPVADGGGLGISWVQFQYFQIVGSGGRDLMELIGVEVGEGE